MQKISDIKKKDLFDLYLRFRYLSQGYFKDEIDSYPDLKF